MSVFPTSVPTKRRILTPYVMIWLAIASFALAYLVLLGLRPHMFARTAQNVPDIEQKLAQTKREVERGLADLDPLRRTVGEVKMDVANLKIAVQEASVRDQVLLEKVTALEAAGTKAPERAPRTTGAAASPPSDVPPTPTQNPRKSTNSSEATTFAPPVGPSAEEIRARATQKSAKVLNGASEGGSNIETGSIERQSAVAPAAKPKAAAKPEPVGVIVAKGPSIDSLRLNWSILTDRHADAVRNMHPRYVVSGKASERTYGLVVGPVASTAEAKSLCTVLQAHGQSCEVGTYRGNAL